MILASNLPLNSAGSFVDEGHNMSSDATPLFTHNASANQRDSLLLPLGNYGGNTLCFAITEASPAWNAANDAASPAIDQRGFPRPKQGGFDIGAFEYQVLLTLQVARTSNNFLLTWPTETNQAYQVETSSFLFDWVTIASNLFGANGTAQLEVSNPPPSFFRIRTQD